MRYRKACGNYRRPVRPVLRRGEIRTTRSHAILPRRVLEFIFRQAMIEPFGGKTLNF